MDWIESAEAIAEVDELLASVGLRHGRRKTLGGPGRRAAKERRRAKVTRGGRRVGGAGGLKGPGGAGARVGEVWWLRHGFSTRAGGVSSIYGAGSLNLGWTKEDEAANVAENRRRFLREGLEGKQVRQPIGDAAAVPFGDGADRRRWGRRRTASSRRRMGGRCCAATA
jgi:hypothetical protein